MKQYSMDLNSEEKALIQNALINMKVSLMDAGEYVEGLDELLERVQNMRPLRSMDHETR